MRLLDILEQVFQSMTKENEDSSLKSFLHFHRQCVNVQISKELRLSRRTSDIIIDSSDLISKDLKLEHKKIYK